MAGSIDKVKGFADVWNPHTSGNYAIGKYLKVEFHVINRIVFALYYSCLALNKIIYI